MQNYYVNHSKKYKTKFKKKNPYRIQKHRTIQDVWKIYSFVWAQDSGVLYIVNLKAMINHWVRKKQFLTDLASL